MTTFTGGEDQQCVGKEALADEVAARRMAMSFRPPLKAYRCPWCSKWHVGGNGHGRGKRPRRPGRRRSR
jgi:hypothetical protein